MARPRKEIDWDIADKAAALFCTGEEIANLCGVSYDTLLTRIKELDYASFSEWFGEKSASTLKSLRRKQLDIALNGNVTMLIWLGKQLLNQKEKQEIEQTNKEIVIKIDEQDKDL
jgi:hypothetical protein